MPTPHDTFREQLLDLSYGELGKREEQALRAHLEACPACRAELAQLEGTRGAMAALGQEPAPERGEAILLAAAREAARQRRPRPFLPAWLWGTSLSAVAAVAVAIVSYKLAQGPSAFQRQAVDELVPSPPPAEVALAPQATPPAAEGQLARAEAPSAPAAADAATASPAAAPPPAAVGGGAPEPRRRAAPAAAPRKERTAAAGEQKVAEELAAPSPRPSPAVDRTEPEELERLDELAAADAAPARSGVEDGAGLVASAAPPGAANAQAAAPPPPAPPEAARRDQPAAAVAGLAEKRAPSVARAKGAASKAAAAAELEDPIARHQRLRVAGRLRTASAAFPGCAAEASREVDLDARGQVVRYTRRGTTAGAPFQAELFYGEDGDLGAVRYQARGRVHEVRIGADGGVPGGSGVPAFALEPRRADQAGLDAPPRCGG